MQYDDYLKGYDFSYSPPIREDYDEKLPIITIILDVFFGLELVKESVKSVLDQTYKNVELIIVDNGAIEGVKEYIYSVYADYPNVALIKFDKNVFAWDDVCLNVVVCWNAALKYAKGEYVSHLAYDDKLSSNYAHKMVTLFLENPDCMTAAPLVKTIDVKGNILASTLDRNRRGRYTEGAEIAIDKINGNIKKLFSAPGEVFVIKRELLLSLGGFDRIVDQSQLLKYAIEGDSGFEPDAVVYWRNHGNQTNKLASKKGMIFYKTNMRGWDESNVIESWHEKFGLQNAKDISIFRDNMLLNDVKVVLVGNIANFRFLTTIRILFNINSECPQYLKLCLILSLKEIFKYPYSIIHILSNFLVRKTRKYFYV